MSLTVADVMTAAPIVVEVPGSRADAINLMVRNGLTGLPVIRASDGKLMGIVSRRDIFRNFEEEQLSLIMKKNCITIEPSAPIEKAAEIYMKIGGREIRQSITDAELAALCKEFGLTPREGYLDL